jgi:predicted metal-dependent hydrolase
MALKQFVLSDGTPITVYKRKASRNLRVTVSPEGLIKVSIPRWAAYAVGVKFAESRLEWIKRQHKPLGQLQNGQPIGKAHRLRFETRPGASRVSSRVARGEVTVYYPSELTPTDPNVQQAARRASTRALRQQAETLLPQRLARLAAKHGFSYNQVTVKQMKSRWGSCDHRRNIVLNLYLMQLPWQNIDYVILHELTHTKVMRHGPDFWAAMVEVLPDVKRLRKEMHDYQPVVHDSAKIMS